jgi:hypothetical protein
MRFLPDRKISPANVAKTNPPKFLLKIVIEVSNNI